LEINSSTNTLGKSAGAINRAALNRELSAKNAIAATVETMRIDQFLGRQFRKQSSRRGKKVSM
jgi:hypothetical protein